MKIRVAILIDCKERIYGCTYNQESECYRIWTSSFERGINKNYVDKCLGCSLCYEKMIFLLIIRL
ncbi:MAG: hypothetical protein N2746_01040 [Deltaproteobacteria bacterium]|nr:hypothetical protein [Deltaproteobacteria bacterium]